MSGVRIASLLPSATEICYALGLGDAVVGVSHECDFPPAARTKPVLTSSRLDGNLESQAIDDQVRSLVQEGLSIYAVDEVRLAQLQPTLVLTQDTCSVCAVPFVEVERATLRTLGPGARIVSLSPNTIEALFADIIKIGGLVGTPGRAKTLVAAMRARLTRLQARTATLPRRTVLHLEWLEPPMVAGHWTPSLLLMAGKMGPEKKKMGPGLKVSAIMGPGLKVSAAQIDDQAASVAHPAHGGTHGEKSGP
ncbi:MAG: ABC transporter substrate-binding protein [Nannocystaceae bacterium]|nr:ABC transporter substrate-binding protein [Nannocystaceae bacterium]